MRNTVVRVLVEPIEYAEVIVRRSIIRLELDRALEMRLRIGRPLQNSEQKADLILYGSGSRIQFRRPFVEGQRALRIAGGFPRYGLLLKVICRFGGVRNEAAK